MISVKQFRKLLAADSVDCKDSEIEQIRNFLYKIVEEAINAETQKPTD